MKTKNFELVAKNEFRFLETDYNFRLVKCKHERWGDELIYLSDKMGIKITYEFNEAYIFITLYKLVKGKLIENPRSIKEDTLLYGYSLDDIIIMLDPSALIKPAYQYGDDSKYYAKENGLTLYTHQFAKNLKKYAKDILKGNVEIFEKVDRIVKQRARINQ